ncbi:CRISPR-associated endoribonuclease Cas6 [Scytonema sp. UIC 10036]|uniref:CRISPR-associated endoribonuclease Cas6 n=1 Tax=Scytonema sp. UIC 10036 TaxID=2304196 RepID=UPI0012DAA32E|nr:CRISPR-associated endoribonuclease Cas6 [Scytonema sp. UIC 10036]MUG98603.1 CRISPR-associated endoribonuclease Cas6 [Scytonema sp. UIC 10036]
MPHSLVLHFFPQSPILPQFLTGRHLHALFLNLVSSVDRKLGDRLHDSTADKAFTISPLQVKANASNKSTILDPILQWEHVKPIPTGTSCWWRISLLDDNFFGQLTQLWLNLNPAHPWHLGPADLYITTILGTPHTTQPWANATTYAQLYEQASDSERQIALSFCTPTNFRQGHFDTALPTRECVFNSLLQRWNKYSGISLESNLTEFIFPSFFNIRTAVAVDSRSKFIGCVGEINYRILGQVDPSIIKHINALADFALYCGAGRKTTMGMGMIRRLEV